MLSNLLNNQVYHPLFMRFAYFITTRRLFEFSNIATICNDAWQIRNGTEGERKQLACASDTPYVVTFLFIWRFSCVVDKDCQVWLTLKCLATLCQYRVSLQDTPKTVVVKRLIEELQRTAGSLRQNISWNFLPRNMIKTKQNSHIFHVLPGRICVVFFSFNFLIAIFKNWRFLIPYSES